MFARRKTAQKSGGKYVQDVIIEMEETSSHYIISESIDHSRLAKTRKNCALVSNPRVLAETNRQMKEPTRLLFYEGALFESTLNYKSKIREIYYSQSQLLIIADVPIIDQVNKEIPIEMYAAKAGVNRIDVRSGVSSKEDLVAVG